MKLEYNISFLNCQACTAKIHCDACGETLSERLGKEGGLSQIEIDIPNRHLSLQADGWDEMDLLDALEEIGIFAD